MRDGLYDPVAGTVKRTGCVVEVPEADRWALERIPGGQADRYAKERRRIFADFRPDEQCGDPLCHLVVSANGTGLLPDTPVCHHPVVRFSEIPEILCPVEDGGILQTRGAIDVPTILWTQDQPHGGGGVFAVVANADEHSRNVMIRKGLFANSRGTAMLIYRPYHLCGAETAMSILCAGLLEVPTGNSEILPRVDMTVEVKRNLKSGEVLRTGTLGHNPDFRASLLPAISVVDNNPLPFYMLEGNQLSRDIPANTMITRDMVVPPQDSILWRLRKQQDEHFLSG